MSKVKENADAEYQPKVQAIYQAVFELFEEGADLNSLTVSEITKKPASGKVLLMSIFPIKKR